MKKILIIDDDDDFRLPLAKVLRKAGYDVVAAADGREGMFYFRSSNIDLVITDLIMPRQDGFETIKAIRRLNKEVVIVAISGGDPETAGKYLTSVLKHLGVAATFVKPLSEEEAIGTVKRLLGGACPPDPSPVASAPDQRGG